MEPIPDNLDVLWVTRDQLLKGWVLFVCGVAIKREYEVIREPLHDDGMFLVVQPKVEDEILPNGMVR